MLKVFLKAQDKPKDKIKSYRPITLLPVLGKITERIIAGRLMEWLGTINYFGPSQHGFLKGRSTTTAMIELRNRVDETREQYVMGLFLDISGAFDNAWWPLVMANLRESGCPDYLLKLIANYLEGRTVEFEWGSAKVSKTLTKGCPQGSILGPLLWNVMFEPLL